MVQNPLTLSTPETEEPQRASGSIRVLHLHSGNMMGGIESMLLTVTDSAKLCPDLKQSFALTFDSALSAQLRRKRATVHLLPQVRLRHLPSIYQSRKQLRALLRQFHFDVVIAHSTWIQLLFGDVARDFGIPVVFWMHGPFDGHWLQKLASVHRPDFAIANSRFTHSTLDRCWPRLPSTIIHYPVHASEAVQSRDEVRASLGLNPEQIVILLAARMESWKGHRNLLASAEKITSSVPWRILIAGAPNTNQETAYFESLRRMAAASKLNDRVQFLGFRSDVPALLAAADIHCQPNEKPEPFGIVFVEALHAGVPPVTYAMGGAGEILDSGCGILVPPGDTASLAAALSKLIDDPPLRKQLGMNGPARASELCDPARQMRTLTDTLQSVVEHRKVSRK